jgi:transposase
MRGAFRHTISQRQIHKQIVAVYGNVTNRQNVTKWCREFSEGRTAVQDEQRRGRPSLISGDLLRAADFYDSERSWFIDLINVWTMPATI